VHRKLTFLLCILVFLSACNLRGGGTPTPLAPTFTPAPTATSTPVAKPLVILVIPADMPQEESKEYQSLIYDLAEENGMRFQVRNTLSSDEMAFEGSALKVVVALPPDPGLVELAAAAPDVQFLAVDIPDLNAGSNLSTVGSTGIPIDQQAFLAGYIAGMLATEWRVGILSQKETDGGDEAVTAFSNGYHFYCGDCFNPNFSMGFSHGDYPVIVRIPTDASESDYSAYGALLVQNFVKVAYLYPEIATYNLASYMAQNDVLLVGQTLPGEDIRPEWITSIESDLPSAIQGIFPDLIAGNGGQAAPTPLLLKDVNSDLFSDAKLRLAQDVLNGLQNGTIGTGVNP
jgi:hypothetical protein